eukprot:gene11054-28224_t
MPPTAPARSAAATTLTGKDLDFDVAADGIPRRKKDQMAAYTAGRPSPYADATAPAVPLDKWAAALRERLGARMCTESGSARRLNRTWGASPPLKGRRVSFAPGASPGEQDTLLMLAMSELDVLRNITGDLFEECLVENGSLVYCACDGVSDAAAGCRFAGAPLADSATSREACYELR